MHVRFCEGARLAAKPLTRSFLPTLVARSRLAPEPRSEFPLSHSSLLEGDVPDRAQTPSHQPLHIVVSLQAIDDEASTAEMGRKVDWPLWGI